MKQTAEIIEVFDDGTVTVRAERTSACAVCARRDGCSGSCNVGTLIGSGKSMTARAVNSAGAHVGDTVEINCPESRILFFSLIVFILPLVLCGIAYAVGICLSLGERASILMSLSAFILTFAAIGVFERHHRTAAPDITVVRIILTHNNVNGNCN